MPSLGTQNSILGLYVLNQSVPADSLVSNDRGVYYSRLFKKPSTHIWYQLSWKDNQNRSTFEEIDVDVRLRTMDVLPFNYDANTPYTFDGFNAFIKDNNADAVDGVLYRWHLTRSLLGVSGTSTVVNGNVSGDDSVFELGTAYNTTRIPSKYDGVCNYWSLPHLHNKSYIANNVNHDYLQLRIDLRNLDPNSVNTIDPQMFNITVSSLLKQSS